MKISEPTMRRDAQRTRDRLVLATGELLETVGPNFTLPELARQAGVGVATVYRHFTDPTEAHHEFERRTVLELVELIAALPDDLTSLQRFERICVIWVRRSQNEVAAARFIRSPHGFLQRLQDSADTPMHALALALQSCLRRLIEDQQIPQQDLDTATLIWATLFDERIVVDLARGRKWSAKHIAAFLGDAVLGAWGRRKLG